MGHQVSNNSYLSLGGTSLVGDGFSLDEAWSQELPEDPSWGDSFNQRLLGLQDYEVSFEAHADYVDNALDEDVEALKGTHFAVAWRPVNDTISTSNPEFQFTGAFSDIKKSFRMNEPMKVTGTIKISTSAVVTRDVTP